MSTATITRTLYERLGSADGISRLVDDVMAAHLTNPVVKAHFLKIKDLDRAKKMAREFFCAGAGGPETYTGKDMVAAHKGMHITEEEYQAVSADIIGAMEKHRLSEDTKKDVIAIIQSLKSSIVGV